MITVMIGRVLGKGWTALNCAGSRAKGSVKNADRENHDDNLRAHCSQANHSCYHIVSRVKSRGMVSRFDGRGSCCRNGRKCLLGSI